MSYRDELKERITYLRQKAENMQKWIDSLDEDGFDWDNVTEPQRYAIESLICPGKKK